MSLARRFNAGISVNDAHLVASATTEHQPSLRDALWNASGLPALKGRAKVISSLRDAKPLTPIPKDNFTSRQ
jgi:hypothetical protein